MTTFDQITQKNSNSYFYLKNLYDSLLDSVEKLYLNHGYIPLDMKEENLVIDESERKHKVIFIDTDPKFFVKININKKYVKSVKLFVLLMILFFNNNMGPQGTIKRKLNLYGNNQKLFTSKIRYLRLFYLILYLIILKVDMKINMIK